jgi:O-succinylbenzoic acid--CoA ligase
VLVNELVALALPGGPAFVDALKRTWDDGDAVFPLDLRLPPPARRAVLDAMQPSAVVDAHGRHSLDRSRPVEAGDALVVATSGTAGEPKGVVLTYAAVEASARASSARIGARSDDAWLACLPLSHVGGLSVITRALVLGVPLSVHSGFDAVAVEQAAAAGCTLVSLVPTALARIDPARFRMIVLGGSRPPPDRPANCVATYGLTETGSGIVYDGWPLDGVELRIDDASEIWVRGPMLMRGYRDGSTPIDADGWLPTGDLGSWNADGSLSVHGRRGELIITGGENVWPEHVERVLQQHSDIADVGVAGRPDPEWGMRVVAYVVPSSPGDPPSLAELRATVKAELAAFCAPREVVYVDAIPRTSLGKIRRALLAGVNGSASADAGAAIDDERLARDP